ncbi:MAG: hypothetical protein O2783_08330, partial [Chloroflexi bacterium]|nr:hypothetical protein [Chloroflexota bacterium]
WTDWKKVWYSGGTRRTTVLANLDSSDRNSPTTNPDSQERVHGSCLSPTPSGIGGLTDNRRW